MNIGVSKIVSISVIIVLVAGGLFFVKSVLKISSRAFEHNSSIPSKYTCDGENINPPFSVSDVP